MSMELKIITNFDKLPKIEFNNKELKAEIEEKIGYYKSLVVTDESLKDAKADRARLSKLREAFENKRKEIKSLWNENLAEFETNIKDVISPIDEAISAIDDQTAVFKKMEQERKTVEIATLYNELAADVLDIVPLEKMWNARWLNVTYAIKEIQGEITEVVQNIKNDLATLETVENEFAEAVKIKYLATLDIRAALNERTLLREKAEKLREYERQVAERKAAAEAASKKTAEVQAKQAQIEEMVTDSPAVEPMPYTTIPKAEKVYSLTFECKVTLAQANALKAFLDSNNIEYRRITDNGSK